MAYLIKDLTLSLAEPPPGVPAQVECQLSTAELVDNPTTEDITTFCGTETFASPKYELHLAGWQDYGAVAAVCDMLHAAYTASPVAELDFVLALGPAGAQVTRSGAVKPNADVPFGGNAGSALTFDVTLSVIGAPIDGVLP